MSDESEMDEMPDSPDVEVDDPNDKDFECKINDDNDYDDRVVVSLGSSNSSSSSSGEEEPSVEFESDDIDMDNIDDLPTSCFTTLKEAQIILERIQLPAADENDENDDGGGTSTSINIKREPIASFIRRDRIKIRNNRNEKYLQLSRRPRPDAVLRSTRTSKKKKWASMSKTQRAAFKENEYQKEQNEIITCEHCNFRLKRKLYQKHLDSRHDEDVNYKPS